MITKPHLVRRYGIWFAEGTHTQLDGRPMKITFCSTSPIWAFEDYAEYAKNSGA